MSINNIIEINNFSLKYAENPVLSELNLNIEKQSIHGILGGNGAGKTSLFNAIFNNKNFLNYIVIDDNYRTSIAFLETENFFYSYMTGMEYLQVISNNEDESIKQWNELFDLPLDKYVSSYSTGMKKKIAILGCFLLKKEILLLDEPFNGLDLKSVEAINYAMQKFKSIGKTILLSSHILETLTRNCDRISYIESGKVFRTFEKEEFYLLEQIVSHKLKSNITDLLDRLIDFPPPN